MPSAVIEALSDEESYLYAILTDPSGLDLAEFSWYDPTRQDGCFRAFHYQVSWWRHKDQKQIEMSARAVGKTISILVRMFAFPFCHPGQEALLTAPELVHLEPIADLVESRFYNQRLGREVIKEKATHRPFLLNFKNQARILGRIPQRDGKGVKGTHPLVLEQDEASDYPEPGWTELIETLRRDQPDSAWHAHGVTIGVGNAFHRNSEHAVGDPPLRPISHASDGRFTVHRVPAMAHPNWSDAERESKMLLYSDESEYRRNVLGLPGDAMSPIFRSVQLQRSIEDNLAMPFNEEIYWRKDIRDTDLNSTQRDLTDVLGVPPVIHQNYKTCWAGMDVGLVGDPTEILIAREYHLSDEEHAEMKKRSKANPSDSRLQIITRISLKKIGEPAQADLIMWICDNYPIKRFAFDATGVGLPIFQIIQYAASDNDPVLSARANRTLGVIKGYGFSENILVDFDERLELDSDRIDEKIKKQGIERNVKEYSTDVARLYVEQDRMWFPWDIEMIKQYQASKQRFVRDAVDRYGRRKRAFTQGDDHILDALRMLVLGYKQLAIDTYVAADHQGEVEDHFLSSEDFEWGWQDPDGVANW